MARGGPFPGTTSKGIHNTRPTPPEPLINVMERQLERTSNEKSSLGAVNERILKMDCRSCEFLPILAVLGKGSPRAGDLKAKMLQEFFYLTCQK